MILEDFICFSIELCYIPVDSCQVLPIDKFVAGNVVAVRDSRMTRSSRRGSNISHCLQGKPKLTSYQCFPAHLTRNSTQNRRKLVLAAMPPRSAVCCVQQLPAKLAWRLSILYNYPKIQKYCTNWVYWKLQQIFNWWKLFVQQYNSYSVYLVEKTE